MTVTSGFLRLRSENCYHKSKVWITSLIEEAKRGEEQQKTRKKQKIGVKPANSVDKNAGGGV